MWGDHVPPFKFLAFWWVSRCVVMLHTRGEESVHWVCGQSKITLKGDRRSSGKVRQAESHMDSNKKWVSLITLMEKSGERRGVAGNRPYGLIKFHYISTPKTCEIYIYALSAMDNGNYNFFIIIWNWHHQTFGPTNRQCLSVLVENCQSGPPVRRSAGPALFAKTAYSIVASRDILCPPPKKNKQTPIVLKSPPNP